MYFLHFCDFVLGFWEGVGWDMDEDEQLIVDSTKVWEYIKRTKTRKGQTG